LKTADAGYLTRRLVDVAQDVIITEPDCGTLRGLTMEALKQEEEIFEKLSERILGRTSVHDIYHPVTNELIVASGEEIVEEITEAIDKAGIEQVEIRSVLTCETRQGVCAKCYGRSLPSGKMVHIGEAAGVIAAQSIGEPGTQLTLRTFHAGGVAGSISTNSSIKAKFAGKVEFEDLKTVVTTSFDGSPMEVVMARTAEARIIGDNKVVLITYSIPYGSFLKVKDGDILEKGKEICFWDPYNAVILAQYDGVVEYDAIEEGITFREEMDEQTGYTAKVIIDSKERKKNPG
jgi:DNA-directed RNA polymerase subunit beta'